MTTHKPNYSVCWPISHSLSKTIKPTHLHTHITTTLQWPTLSLMSTIPIARLQLTVLPTRLVVCNILHYLQLLASLQRTILILISTCNWNLVDLLVNQLFPSKFMLRVTFHWLNKFSNIYSILILILMFVTAHN